MFTRTIDLSNIIQIGIVVKNIRQAASRLEEKFGIGPFEIVEAQHPNLEYKGRPTNFRVLIGIARNKNNMLIELIEPLGGENIYTEFLRTKGEGLQHLGVEVEDIDKAIAQLKKEGIGVVQAGEGKKARKYAYLDSERTFGITFELIEWRK